MSDQILKCKKNKTKSTTKRLNYILGLISLFSHEQIQITFQIQKTVGSVMRRLIGTDYGDNISIKQQCIF